MDHEGDTLPCVYTITTKGPKWKQVRKSLIRSWNAYPIARTEWVVLLHATIGWNGKINTLKCRNPGYPFASDVVALFECEGEADADMLNEWLRSPEFQGIAKDGIAKLGGPRRTFINRDIMKRLPSHR